MMSNTPAYTVNQIVMQTLLTNNYVEATDTEFAKGLAFWPRALSTAQQYHLNRLVSKITGVATQPAQTTAPAVAHAPTPPPVTIPNISALVDMMRHALTALKRPHIYIPLDPTKPIDRSCDVLKIDYKPYGFGLKAKIGGQNEYLGELHFDGTLKVRKWNWLIRNGKISEQLIEQTLTTLCADPVGTTSKWGKLLSRCCYCYLPLSTPESLAAGYGDTCAKHYNLPWGKQTAGRLTQDEILGLKPVV